jgi:lipid-A-disaccharide synthase
LRILISAGEASGEMYGAQLIEALRRRAMERKTAEVRSAGQPYSTRFARSGQAWAAVPTQANQLDFFGVGGDRMRAAGCDTVLDAKDLAVVGITEVLGRLPKIYGLFRRLIREADRRRPDLAVVIDSPAFNWRVARQMKKRGIPTVYYVAPQFWAWRQGRVRLLRNYIDKALVIFPFEEQFYRDRGVDATFVGHPLAELPHPAIERADYAAQFGLDAAKQWITLMPGSRVKEVRMNLPTILEAAAVLGDAYEFLLPIAPTLERSFLSGLIRREETARGGLGEKHSSLTKSQPPALKRGSIFNPRTARVNSCSSQLCQDAEALQQVAGITLVPEALPALWHSRAGIVASGTATVEAAMMATPFVMVYRVSPLTYLLGKPRVKVPRFAMVNLIAEEEVVPELVQHDFTATNVVARLKEILGDGPARDRMLEGLARVKSRLRAPAAVPEKAQHPADRAAEIILSLASSQWRGMDGPEVS